MTRQEFNNKDFEEIMEQLNEERDDITTYEMLKKCAIDNINDDDLLGAIHILKALREDVAKWYEYDYCWWILQTPSSITEKSHIEYMIED